jgi:hypothetical protein
MKLKVPAFVAIGVFAAALTLALPHSASSASAIQQLGSVAGKVVDGATGAPINAAKVSVRGTPLLEATAGDGTFLIENVPVGGVVLEVARIGYKPREVSISVAPSDVSHWTIALARLTGH